MWIHVVDDEGKNVPEVTGQKDGGSPKPTDTNGLATYDPLPPGQYTASIGDLSSKLAKEYIVPKRREEKVHVAQGQITYAGFELTRRAQLKVRVVKAGSPATVFADADVEVVEGPDKPPKGKTAGPAGMLAYLDTFGKLTGGDYKIKAALKPDDAKKFATVKDFTAATEDLALAPGSDETVTIEVEPKNLVAPKIELEYKVVLLDRQLAQHQDKPGEKPIRPDATRVEISLLENDASLPDQVYGGSHHPAQGGVLTCTPANVDIFLDEACTPAMALPASGELTGEQLKTGAPLKLYLRGKTPGKFKLKIELKPPVDRFIVNDDKVVEVEMGVVELQMTLHQYLRADILPLKVDPNLPPPGGKNYDPTNKPNDSAAYHTDLLADYHKRLNELVLPAQKPMSDKEKIAARARLLSVQDGVGSRARAKLVVKPLVADQWPDGTDDYVVYLNRVNLSGGVGVFATETEGDIIPFPVAQGMKVSELKAAEKIFWIEGREATKAAADVQLDLTLDRDEGGLAKEAKRNGDAARFTVIDFKSMKLEFTPEANKPLRWDEATERCYENVAPPNVGRVFTFGVQLTQPIAGVRVHFMLAPDPKNQRAENSGIALPAGGKVYWNRKIPLILGGKDAACFEIRNSTDLYLKDGMLSLQRKPRYEVEVSATYSDGNTPIHTFKIGSADNVDSSAGIKVKSYTLDDFPLTSEALWKWDEIDKSVKHADKSAEDNYIYVSALTDAKGYAKHASIRVSRYAGDVFTPACYIEQDPHLAKYVEGHADLGKRVPYLAAKKLRVWRRGWLQKVTVQGLPMPDFKEAMDQYEPLRAEFTQHTDLVIPRATADGFNPKAIYKRYMIEVNGGQKDAIVVSDTNKAQFFTTFAAQGDKPNMIPVMVCDAQWDPAGNTKAARCPARRKNAFPVDIDADVDGDGFGVLDPPLQGGNLLISGTWKARNWDDTLKGGKGGWGPTRSGPLAAGDVDINPARDSLTKVRVRLPDAANADHTTVAWIEDLIVAKANIYLGESFNKRILAVYDPKEKVDFQNTIAHEVGHAYAQVMYPGATSPHGRAVPVQARTGPLKVPEHPNARDRKQGNHCRHLVNMCVMYDSGPTKGSMNKFCPVCHPYLLVVDMSVTK
ncbi:MAG: hypothetical protein KAY46_10590 [Burkholderiaceae bacterium]|nr:hypothetical protein [Burkholderiaceae bacterium]